MDLFNHTNIPIIGNTYGQWTIISDKIKKNNNSDKDRNTYWEVQCSCGKITFRSAYTLTSGKTKACMSCAKTKYNSNTYIEAYYNKIQTRIRDKNFETNISVRYLEELLKSQDNRCAISGVKIGFARFKEASKATASLDRKDNKLGYIIGNLHWVHKDINMARGSMELDSFIKMCKIITEYQGSSKC